MDTLILLSGGNQIHRAFGNAIAATGFMLPATVAKKQSMPSKIMNLFKAVMSIPSGFDITVCESCFQYPALKRKLFLLNTKIINMNVGPMLYHMQSGRLSKMEIKILRWLLPDVDGHIVYGKYGKEMLERLGVKKPIRVVYPFVKRELMNELELIQPKLNTHNITLVAKMDEFNKGVDLAISAMHILVKKYPDAKLKIISPIEEIKKYASDYIIIEPSIPKISSLFEGSSLHLAPSRGDMFNVSVLEAMCAGVPCIVSTDNGVKEVVEKIDIGMVVILDAGNLADAIAAYFEKSETEKELLSKKSRIAASFFNEEDVTINFKHSFESLVEEIVERPF